MLSLLARILCCAFVSLLSANDKLRLGSIAHNRLAIFSTGNSTNVHMGASFFTNGRNNEFVLLLLYMIFQSFNKNDQGECHKVEINLESMVVGIKSEVKA